MAINYTGKALSFLFFCVVHPSFVAKNTFKKVRHLYFLESDVVKPTRTNLSTRHDTD